MYLSQMTIKDHLMSTDSKQYLSIIIIKKCFLEYGKFIKTRIFLLVDLRIIYCNFPESRKKLKFNFIFFLFYPPTLNIICLLEKK